MRSAGDLVRQARTESALSQAELARRAGITQSVISAYESGSRQPSLPMLTRLIEASGHVLDISVGRLTTDPSAGSLRKKIKARRKEILKILASYGLSNPRLFGSAVRDQDRPGSDVDLLVDIPGGVGLFAIGRCRSELEAVIGAPVDLVPASDLKPGVATEVISEAVPI